MLIGILSATLSFVITYSKLQSVSEVTLKSSTVIRTFEERSLLLANRGKIITISFGGYIFFGSSVQVLEQIKSKLVLSSTSSVSSFSTVTNEVDEKQQLEGVSSNILGSGASEDLSHPISTPQKPHLVHHQYSMILKTPSSNRKKQFPLSTGNTPYPSKFRNSVPKDDASDDEETSLLMNKNDQKMYGSTLQKSTPPSSAIKLVLKSPAVSRNSDPLQSRSAASSYQSSHFSHPSHRPIPTTYDLSPTSLRNAIQLSQIDNPQAHYSDTIYGNGGPYPRNQEVPDKENDIKEKRKSDTTVENGSGKDDKTWLMDESDDVFDISHHDKCPNKGRWSSSQGSIVDDYSPFKELRESKISERNDDRQNEGINSTLKPSTSLLDLVFKGQQQRREKQQLLHRKTSHELSPPDGLSSSSHGNSNSTPPRKIAVPRFTGLPPLPTDPAINCSSPGEPSTAVDTASSYFPLSILHPSNAYSNEETVSVSNEGEITTEYLVLDFTDVKGVDATAARSCFLTLVHLMKNANVTVVFASLNQELQGLLKAHHVIDNHSIIIPDIDDALEWCEDQVLARLNFFFSVSLFSYMIFFYTSHYESLAEKQNGQSTRQTSSRKFSSKHIKHYIEAFTQRQSIQAVLKSPRKNHSFSLNGAEAMEMSRLNSRSDDNGDYLDLEKGCDGSDVLSLPIKPLRMILDDYLEIRSFSIYSSQHSNSGADESAFSAVLKPSNSIALTDLNPIQKLLDLTILTQYFSYEVFPSYYLIYDIDNLAEKVYFIEKGSVELVTMSPDMLESEPPLDSTADGLSSNNNRVKRVNKVLSGGIFGESDFFLGKNHRLISFSSFSLILILFV
jgi:hypothetical protein